MVQVWPGQVWPNTQWCSGIRRVRRSERRVGPTLASCIPEDRNTAEPLSPEASVATEPKGCLCRWSRCPDGQFFATCVSQSVSQVTSCSFHQAIEMAITTKQRMSPDSWASYRELYLEYKLVSGAEQAHSAPRSLCGL